MKVFFPPRLVDLDATISDSNDQLDNAVGRYLEESLAVLLSEDSLKDALKVIEFAEQFDDLVRP